MPIDTPPPSRRSPLTDMLPESVVWRPEFKAVTLTRNVDCPNRTPGTLNPMALTIDTITAVDIPGGEGAFALASAAFTLCPGNPTGADPYNITADYSGPTPATWGRGGTSAAATSTGHVAYFAIAKNWVDPSVGGLVDNPPLPVNATGASTGTVDRTSINQRYPFSPIIAIAPLPAGDWAQSYNIKQVETVRSFEADPIRFDRQDSLSAILIIDGVAMDTITASPGTPFNFYGYCAVDCKLRLVGSRTTWAQ